MDSSSGSGSERKKNPSNFPGGFQIISDDESLEDHSGAIDDFQGVTLQINDNVSEGGLSPSSDLGKTAEERTTILLTPKTENHNGGVPKISLTPMTPPSEISEIDGHSTISLSSGGTPYGRGGYKKYTTSIWRAQSPSPPANENEAKDFFAFRDTLVHNCIEELQTLAIEEIDGKLRGTWLLTEIDLWDNEKERIVLLCEKSIIIVKYDFIAMKLAEQRRISHQIIDKVVQGELKYPDRSLAPRLNGIAGGLISVVKGVSGAMGTKVCNIGNAVLYRNKKSSSNPEMQNSTYQNENETVTGGGGGGIQGDVGGGSGEQTSIMSALSLEKFEPRTRNVQGLRLMWNQDQELTFNQRWIKSIMDKNSIPVLTFASHPLLWQKGGGGGIHRSFDVESFSRELMDILSSDGGEGQISGTISPTCRVEYKSIIIESYLGLTSLFHNANSLGFYKVRGKISF